MLDTVCRHAWVTTSTALNYVVPGTFCLDRIRTVSRDYMVCRNQCSLLIGQKALENLGMTRCAYTDTRERHSWAGKPTTGFLLPTAASCWGPNTEIQRNTGGDREETRRNTGGDREDRQTSNYAYCCTQATERVGERLQELEHISHHFLYTSQVAGVLKRYHSDHRFCIPLWDWDSALEG